MAAFAPLERDRATPRDTVVAGCIPFFCSHGQAKGHRISKKEMAYMKQEYYKTRGWDTHGVPLDKTLKELRIW